jgi:acetolactate synthase-1/2/3 large subunit
LSTVANDLMRRLRTVGYTHCFFVPGGNSMHLLEAASHEFRCVPFVNEHSAAIAAEYFTALSDSNSKAFCLVTSGPGVTNVVSALAGAYLESRELLVVAGQVKSTDLRGKSLRQRGIQEVDAIAAVSPYCLATLSMTSPHDTFSLERVIAETDAGRKGPVFVEVCLDVQAAPLPGVALEARVLPPVHRTSDSDSVSDSDGARPVVELLRKSKRPLLLVGGGLPRSFSDYLQTECARLQIPVATTWNALDRVDHRHPLFFGRPDTWGMRWANLLLQQADMLVVIGARLGLQQTGFNWAEFCPGGDVIHVDIDPAELAKDHPEKLMRVEADGVAFLREVFTSLNEPLEVDEWLEFRDEVRELLPLNDPENLTRDNFISPYQFALGLSEAMTEDGVLIPCSSGGASTVLMQAFQQKSGQLVINSRALASMGYGLAGAVGAALAYPHRGVVLTEGDGGFAQNLSELGTVSAQGLNIKMFIFANDGYASIRTTQRNYFNGNYLGCDAATGLGLPNLEYLARTYDIPYLDLPAHNQDLVTELREILDRSGPELIRVGLDPEQTYFPKINSRISESGGMESNPLHHMSPPLADELLARVGRYLPEESR